MYTDRINFYAVFITFFVMGNLINAQEAKLKKIILKGTVKNSEEKPIRGALVYVDSVRTNAKTNKKGEFKVKILGNAKTISFYSPSYGIADVAYIGQESINYVFSGGLKSVNMNELSRLGYRDPEKKVYGSGEINFENDPSVINYSDIFQLIGVRFAGVTVVGESISIRGSANNSVSNSLSGSDTDGVRVSQEPLYLVNGSPVSSISTIAPDQVKSIKILKSSESGRYGIRGANGVVLITLKN